MTQTEAKIFFLHTKAGPRDRSVITLRVLGMPLKIITSIKKHSPLREVSEEETRQMYEQYVKPYFPALTDKCVKAIACMYTITPDFGFIIDRHPKYPSVIIASPCSGHGFKHSAAIGEVLSQMVMDGKPKINIGSFKMTRFLAGQH